MIKIEDIIEEWEKDGEIDEIALDDTTIHLAKIHSKYLGIHSQAKLLVRKLNLEIEILKKDKWLYYTGKMTQAEMDERGWPYDPFGGHNKPLKSELNYYINADADVQKIMARIAYAEEKVEVVKEIMGNIRFKGNHIKNIIEWRKFQSGV
jgi:hypothetical protein